MYWDGDIGFFVIGGLTNSQISLVAIQENKFSNPFFLVTNMAKRSEKQLSFDVIENFALALLFFFFLDFRWRLVYRTNYKSRYSTKVSLRNIN